MHTLGFNAPSEALCVVFDDIDEDRSGIIDFRELSRAIRSQHSGTKQKDSAKQKDPTKQEVPNSPAVDKSAVVEHLRARLGDGMLVSGDKQARFDESGAQLRTETKLEAAQRMLSTHASAHIQAHARGQQVRSRPAERRWTFATTHVAELTPGEECVFHVRANERLDLLSASGVGRVMLDATDPSGVSRLPCKSCVWDSGLIHFNKSFTGQRKSPTPAANSDIAAIFSGPGVQTYVFCVEDTAQSPRNGAAGSSLPPISGGQHGEGRRSPTALVKLKFSLEMLMLERNLIEEDAPLLGALASRRHSPTHFGTYSNANPSSSTASMQHQLSARGEVPERTAPQHEDAPPSHARNNNILVDIAPLDYSPPSARGRSVPRVSAGAPM